MADIVESTEKNTGRRCFVIADDGTFSLLTQRDETSEETFERETRENERKDPYYESEEALEAELSRFNRSVDPPTNIVETFMLRAKKEILGH